MGALWSMTKSTVLDWWNDNASRWAASITFYTLFSLAPVLLIAISIAAMVFGQEAAQGGIFHEIEGIVGSQAATFIQDTLANAQQYGSSVWATIIGVVLLLVGATGVFGEFQAALNAIWEVQPKPGLGIMGFLRTRFLSFAMVVVIGFLLLVSLLMSAILAAMGKWFIGILPGSESVWQVVNFLVSLLVFGLLFAAMFKFLPDAKVRWRDVWVGAGITALLFAIGKFVIGLYLGHSSVASTYGAAGSLVVILLWVYYTVQIILLGAEFTQSYARHFGRGIVPADNAQRMPESTPAKDAPKG